MDSTVFADTSFFIARVWPRDPHRAQAEAWERRIADQAARIVTTEAVLWEFLNAFAGRPTRRLAIEAYDAIHSDGSIRVVGFESSQVSAALRLYGSRQDKDWSVVDCLSFVVMAAELLTGALTADHHFEQAGYTSLLLHPPSDP